MLCPLTGFPNKEKKKLVYLAGTLPVHYEGGFILSSFYVLFLNTDWFHLTSGLNECDLKEVWSGSF